MTQDAIFTKHIEPFSAGIIMENTDVQSAQEKAQQWKDYVRRLGFTSLRYEVSKNFKHAKRGMIWRITGPNTFYWEYIDGFILKNFETGRVIEIVCVVDKTQRDFIEELDDGDGAYVIYDFPFFLKHFRWLQDYDDGRNRFADDKMERLVPESSPNKSHIMMMNCAYLSLLIPIMIIGNTWSNFFEDIPLALMTLLSIGAFVAGATFSHNWNQVDELSDSRKFVAWISPILGGILGVVIILTMLILELGKKSKQKP